MKKVSKWLLPLTFIVAILIYTICFTEDKIEYFKVPFYHLLNISIAFLFAFFVTQRKNDERKQKDMHEKLINKIYNAIDNEKMYIINSEEDLKYITITRRGIRNRMDLLEKQTMRWIKKDDVAYLKNEFNDYWDILSEHISDIEYLKKSQDVLYKNIGNITYKLQEMLLNLYTEI